MRTSSVVVAVVGCSVAIVLGKVAVAARTSDFPDKGSLSTAKLQSLTFAGERRDYLIQPVPTAGRHPVVIVLHGGNSNFRTVWMETSLPSLGARFGFLVVAP